MGRATGCAKSLALFILLSATGACGTSSPPVDGPGTPPTFGVPHPSTGSGSGEQDGGPPVGPGSEGPFCTALNPAPKLCEDFEDGTPPHGSDTQIDTGASASIDDNSALSK